MKVARYEVPGIGQKYGPVPEGRLKSGCALNYAGRISRLPRIRRPSGTRPFFVCYPGNKLPGYYREVPPGQEAYPASVLSSPTPRIQKSIDQLWQLTAVASFQNRCRRQSDLAQSLPKAGEVFDLQVHVGQRI